jgi:energy-coupling factor transporter ATP-binding protein EcfA2
MPTAATLSARLAGSWPTSPRTRPALPDAALEFVLDGDVELRQIERDLAAAEDHHDDHHAGEQIGLLHSRLGEIDGYAAPARAAALMHGLGFSDLDFQRPVAKFSGGWRVRLNLARALMCRSDLLLLDEPTNHLDLDAILWLEDWLKSYQGTLILISHDRDFLDVVTTHILAIENGKLQLFTGNYSACERARARAPGQRPGIGGQADARGGAPAKLHRPLPCQGLQGAPGAKPDQDAGQDGARSRPPTSTRPSASASPSRAAFPIRCC